MLDRFTGYKRLLALAALNGGGASIIERTAIGNPLTFITDLARPLKSLLIPFTPRQEGTGDPSPQNIRSILPWNGLTVFGGGKNLFDKASTVYNVIVSSGEIYQTANGRTVFVPCMPNTTYTVSKVATTRSVIAYAKTEEIPVNGDPVFGAKDYRNNTSESITTGADAKWLVLYLTNTGYDQTPVEQVLDSVQLEVGSSPSSYEPYHPITDTDIVFPSAVYGGTLDVVSGVLTVEWATADIGSFKYSLDKTLTGVDMFYVNNFPNRKQNDETLSLYSDVFKWEKIGDANRNFDTWVVCPLNARMYFYTPAGTYETPSDFETAMTGKQIVFELATPQEIQLTPAQLTALIGNNTIWSDADGSMTAVYLLTESFGDEHPISGGLGSGLLGGGFGSGSGEPDEPGEPDQPDEPAEPDQPGEE